MTCALCGRRSSEAMFRRADDGRLICSTCVFHAVHNPGALARAQALYRLIRR